MRYRLPDSQHYLSLPASYSRPGHSSRSTRTDSLAPLALHKTVARLEWDRETETPPGAAHWHHGGIDHSDRGLGSHGRLLGLCDDRAADVAQHDLRAIFCYRRDLLWHRHLDHSHGYPAQSISAAALHHTAAFQQPRPAAADLCVLVGLFHILRVSNRILWQRAGRHARVVF